ncbi:hypothetical protein [Streptomyces sp. NPDC058157]|uniref:hypothetical protein n=1 Tax=Streptomyces sp. NPDC058157 TaxID=3346360 RepID=UPI0036EEC3F7
MNAHPTGSGARSRTASAPDPQRLLAVYLNDHLAGAGSGVSLIRRMARAQRGTPAQQPLAGLAEEIPADRESLRASMTALGVSARWPRVAAGRLAEKAARFKLNGRLAGRSPLSDVLELEAMRLGVEGKASMWRSLRVLALTDRRLDPVALDRLLARAARQESLLEALRVEAARRTFAAPATAPGRSHGHRGAAARHGIRGRTRWA